MVGTIQMAKSDPTVHGLEMKAEVCGTAMQTRAGSASLTNREITMRRPIAAAFIATTLFCAPAVAQTVTPAITAAVTDSNRPAADKERDATRKPAEVAAFAGVKPGVSVAELGSGSIHGHPPHPGQGGAGQLQARVYVIATNARRRRARARA